MTLSSSRLEEAAAHFPEKYWQNHALAANNSKQGIGDIYLPLPETVRSKCRGLRATRSRKIHSAT